MLATVFVCVLVAGFAVLAFDDYLPAPESFGLLYTEDPADWSDATTVRWSALPTVLL